MKTHGGAAYFAMGTTFALAFLLMMVSLPAQIVWLRPDLVTLLLIYWILNLPGVGVYTGFLVGLLFDICAGTLLGPMAMTLSVVAFLTLHLRLRLRIYGFWQKFFIVMILVACGQLLRLWIQLMLGHPPVSMLYWMCSVSSACVWPILSWLLGGYQRSLRLK